ncbi:MAG TPA: hypothetical protein VKR58_02965 [Aquella sp.]|nr:hypothetical protein [Aquella sp.]
MPASEVMSLFRKKKLHSGKSGKVVTNPHQAKAIQLSYLRKEGYDIPFGNALRKHRKKKES